MAALIQLRQLNQRQLRQPSCCPLLRSIGLLQVSLHDGSGVSRPLGQAQRLAILTLSVRNDKVTIDVLRIEPRHGGITTADNLTVYWQSAPTLKAGYWRVGKGLAYVRENERYKDPESFRSAPYPAEESYRWSDYSDGVLAFLPRSYTAEGLAPHPNASVVKERIALWWPPEVGKFPGSQRTISWRLVKTHLSPDQASAVINARVSAGDKLVYLPLSEPPLAREGG